MRQYAPHVDDLLSVVMRDTVVCDLFWEMCSTLCAEFAHIQPSERELIARQTVELLGLIVDGADHGATAKPMKAACYRRMIGIINKDFANPDLGIALLASRTKLSERYLQQVFYEHGTTFSDVIRKRRVTEACRLLLVGRRSSVSEVAYLVGYRDLAHFSRVFKAETGVAPSHYAQAKR